MFDFWLGCRGAPQTKHVHPSLTMLVLGPVNERLAATAKFLPEFMWSDPDVEGCVIKL